MKMNLILLMVLTLSCTPVKCETPETLSKTETNKTEKTEDSSGGTANSVSDFCYVKDGVLYSPEGKTMSLWGVNFQTPISWEANRLSKVGIQKTASALNSVTDNNLDDAVLIGANQVRCHLTPADFTDSKGNIIDSPYLDALDYLIAEADKRNVYVSLAFLNHMGQAGSGQDWAGKGAKTWIHDQEVVNYTRNYISQFLNRTNTYTGKKYSETKNIAFWELINEPLMYSYSEIKETKYVSLYNDWLKAKGYSDTAANYKTYRTETVREYIDSMVDLLRNEGDKHAVCWGLNWHRFRNENEDIFDGVAESKADIVAFCNYPGQDYVESDYSKYRYDFTQKSFAGWFNKYGAMENGYAWTKSEQFAGKAIVCYEFETFFNQSAYLYPIQALFIKSLRGQSASMWTYTFNELADKFGGSHFLNIRCTPAKAASFTVAAHIFSSCDYGSDLTVADEMSGENWCISKSHNAAVFCDKDYYCTSGETASGWSGIQPAKSVKHIYGIADSPLVSYSGSGMYFIDDTDEGLEIDLMPDVKVIGDQFIKSDYKSIVTELNYENENTLSISLSAWENRVSGLYKETSNGKQFISEVSGSKGLSLKPGKYILVKK